MSAYICHNDCPKRLRRLTPIPFALRLLAGVWHRHGPGRVAVLWCDPLTQYARLFPWVELWGPWRDARKYQGPLPIIAHPPCGSWGKLRHFSRQPVEDGIMAMEMVHEWGGVVEQPLGSRLFHLHGRPGATVERVDQGEHGHPGRKPTLLYWV